MKTRLTQSEDKRDLEGVLRPVRWILLTSPLWLATLVFSHTVFSRVSIFSSRSEFKNPPLNNLKKTGLLWRLHSRNHDHRDNLPQPRQLWGVWIFSVVSCFLGGFLFVLRLKRVQHTFTASRNESVPSDDLGLVWYWRVIRRLWLFFFFFYRNFQFFVKKLRLVNYISGFCQQHIQWKKDQKNNEWLTFSHILTVHCSSQDQTVWVFGPFHP